MNLNLHKLLDTFSIYITLDDDKIYKLNKCDLSRSIVDSIPTKANENPIVVIHKKQFDMCKDYLMDMNSPFCISLDTAKNYRDIGFLSVQEYENYEKLFTENIRNKEI